MVAWADGVPRGSHPGQDTTEPSFPSLTKISSGPRVKDVKGLLCSSRTELFWVQHHRTDAGSSCLVLTLINPQALLARAHCHGN